MSSKNKISIASKQQQQKQKQDPLDELFFGKDEEGDPEIEGGKVKDTQQQHKTKKRIIQEDEWDYDEDKESDEGDDNEEVYQEGEEDNEEEEENSIESAIMKKISQMKSEREKCAAISNVLEKKKKRKEQEQSNAVKSRGVEKVLPKQQQQQHSFAVPLPVNTANRKKGPVALPPAPVLSMADCVFPHQDDLKRIADFIWIRLVSYIITNTKGGVIDPLYVITDEQKYINSVRIFCIRCTMLRKQVLKQFKILCQGNPEMTKIADQIHRCKLDAYNKAKYLDSSVTRTGAPVYCVWTLQVIPEEKNVRSFALIPISGALSQKGENIPDPSKEHGVMFHMHSDCANIIKGVHTLLFFLDYLDNEIEKKWKEIPNKIVVPYDSASVWDENIEKQWRNLFTPDLSDGVAKKKKFLAAFVDTVQTQLSEICIALRRVMGDETFIVINK